MLPHPLNWLVAQMGARMHYAVPKVLHRANLLERLFTDGCVSRNVCRGLGLVPSRFQGQALKRLLSRAPVGIPERKISSFNFFGLRYAAERWRASGPRAMTRLFLWANRSFCGKVVGSDWGKAEGVYTFNGAGLEILDRARSEGMIRVSEQTIAPHAIERRLLNEEHELHPGWEEAVDEECARDFAQREQQEWSLCDKIVCGSEFVRRAIHDCGGPADKCLVVPYGVEGPVVRTDPALPHKPGAIGGTRRLHVLTVGTVSLRKGMPYLLDVARQLKGRADFRVVGSIAVSAVAANELKRVLELVGPIPRNEVARHYCWADVFALPSICEGSATAVYEAQAAGLPVICTPNTGSYVQDGESGFIVPMRNSNCIAERLERLTAEPELLMRMSQEAVRRSTAFSLEAYAVRLLVALEQVSR